MLSWWICGGIPHLRYTEDALGSLFDNVMPSVFSFRIKLSTDLIVLDKHAM